MIVSLQGKLATCTVLRAVVVCGGIGYEVQIPVTTAERLGKVGSEILLHTHQVFREDSQALYGFATAEERDFFALVVEKVNGIGPKTAMALFSRLSLSALTQAVATGDLALLASCPGIGKKTAERLVLDLRDKVTIGGTPMLSPHSLLLGLSQLMPRSSYAEPSRRLVQVRLLINLCGPRWDVLKIETKEQRLRTTVEASLWLVTSLLTASNS